MLPGSPMEAIGAGYRWRLLVLAIGEAPKLVRCILREEEMADKTRSDSDAALNKRGTLSVKTKMQQPFDLDSFLSHADAGRTKAKYRKNETIFRQGDSADAVFYIMDGKCKVTVVSEKGKEAVVALHEKGDFFGEGCLTGQPRRLATVIAITMSEMMRFDKATMVRALHDEPKFSELFMSHLLTRNVRVEADLVDQLFNSSEKRLARLLLLMANFGKEGRPEPVIAKVSQETLAEMIGTTRSRVSFFMNKFRKLGFINYNGRLEVHSSLLNMVLHETPGITKVPNRE
jgi:CRP-like cAMP-binding protein